MLFLSCGLSILMSFFAKGCASAFAYTASVYSQVGFRRVRAPTWHRRWVFAKSGRPPSLNQYWRWAFAMSGRPPPQVMLSAGGSSQRQGAHRLISHLFSVRGSCVCPDGEELHVVAMVSFWSISYALNARSFFQISSALPTGGAPATHWVRSGHH